MGLRLSKILWQSPFLFDMLNGTDRQASYHGRTDGAASARFQVFSDKSAEEPSAWGKRLS